MMRRKSLLNLFRNGLGLLLMAKLMIGCTQPDVPSVTEAGLIPLPVEVTPHEGAFNIDARTRIVVANPDEALEESAQWFARLIAPATGFTLQVEQSDEEPGNNTILLRLINEDQLGKEGYKLQVDKKVVTIEGNTPEGVFRGLQTLRQLLPAGIESPAPVDQKWYAPACAILDYPRFEYRGAMLDVSRHFFGVDEVKRFIDYMAAYKLNVLHLHLTDDQGWRIEIKSWPNLTALGGKTEVGGGEGGFYTQEEFKELVQYAHDRFITIIPEIDMPGHTNAALASYAELNENGVATELYTGTEVGFSSLATRKEITYQFIDDVVGELAQLFPGEYFHIGGDESHSTKKDDYIYFMNRVQEIVTAHGKKVIGWDEIATATMSPGSVAQHWASLPNAQLAVQQNARLVLSPASRIYLDMKYDSTTVLGLKWAGFTEVDKAYNWNPDTLVQGVDPSAIWGVEAPLWAETVETLDDIEFLVFPRLPGVAEIGWTPETVRNWDEYKIRLAKQHEWFQVMGINYYQSPLVPWPVGE